jgi:hypothetical protein
MKRIVNAVTYNTETSSVLARHEWEDPGYDGLAVTGSGTLYQTRGGAFFVHTEKTVIEWDEIEREKRQRVRHEFFPLGPEDANKWLLEGDVEIINNPFDDPPEAAAEAEPGATIYIRVPASLKKRVDEAAEAESASGNAWAMRCVERCLRRVNSNAEEAPTGQWIVGRWPGESGVAFKDATGRWWCGKAGAPEMKAMESAPIGWERISLPN